MNLLRQIPLVALALAGCGGTNVVAPDTLTYSSAATVVTPSPTTAQIALTVRNENVLAVTLHYGGCSLGYRLYSIPASSSPVFDSKSTLTACTLELRVSTLHSGEELQFKTGPVNLAAQVPAGRYELRATFDHDGVISEASAGQIDIN
jgi:hypothetical protein